MKDGRLWKNFLPDGQVFCQRHVFVPEHLSASQRPHAGHDRVKEQNVMVGLRAFAKNVRPMDGLWLRSTRLIDVGVSNPNRFERWRPGPA